MSQLRRTLQGLRGYLDRRTPGYLIFFVTPLCDCRCQMCFYLETIRNARRRRVLTLDEIRQIATNFRGLHQVNLSGGEPFLRQDLVQVVQAFYELAGARFFTIPTNSSQVDHIGREVEAILDTCPEAWLRITQSLDGVGELHDTIRGKPGLFPKVVELNRRLAGLARERPNLSVGIAHVMSALNAGHNDAVLDFVYENLEFTDFGALYVRGITPDPAARDISPVEYQRFQRRGMQMRRQHKPPTSLQTRLFTAVNHAVMEIVMETALQDRYILPCQAGRRMVVLDDEGNVAPCEVLGSLIAEGKSPLPSAELGNLRDFDYDIRKLLATPQARDLARGIVESRCYCTFECAAAVNTVYNPRAWPRVLKHFLKL
jgi:MoaA/NifB/PqqE/SkfB family radical SAM enzyme